MVEALETVTARVEHIRSGALPRASHRMYRVALFLILEVLVIAMLIAPVAHHWAQTVLENAS
ncbi:MAG: hypothetical protein WD757_02550 [Actinomycetota bacterium]